MRDAGTKPRRKRRRRKREREREEERGERDGGVLYVFLRDSTRGHASTVRMTGQDRTGER